MMISHMKMTTITILGNNDDDASGDDDDDDEFDCLQRRRWRAGPQLKLEVRHRRTFQNYKISENFHDDDHNDKTTGNHKISDEGNYIQDI